jgi:uncharacterized protein
LSVSETGITEITSAEELREALGGLPAGRAATKDRPALHPLQIEWLRVNGRARIVRDAPFFDDMVVRGRRPVLALLIEIEQVFSHCPKAFLRSGLWEPESWPAAEELPSVAALCKAVQDPPETLAELEAHYAPEHYSGLLY